MTEPLEDEHERKFRRIFAWVFFLGASVLRETTGKLEFEALGFKFRGASGPVVLWVLCYFAITLSIKLLW
jgi:hypothetical protein